MEHCDKIVKEINELLNVSLTPEHNGLQVEGKKEINKIVFGVSANMALFEAAKQQGADMVMTHHGLIWNNPENITGVFGKRVAFLIKNDINLVSYPARFCYHRQGSFPRRKSLPFLHKAEMHTSPC